MPQPVAAKITINITQDLQTEKFAVEITSQVVDGPATASSATIGTDQIFVRLQDVLNGHLRGVCNAMDTQIKQQRKQNK